MLDQIKFVDLIVVQNHYTGFFRVDGIDKHTLCHKNLGAPRRISERAVVNVDAKKLGRYEGVATPQIVQCVRKGRCSVK